MNMQRTYYIHLLALLILSSPTYASNVPTLDIGSGKSSEAIINSRIIFVGEIHISMKDHAVQLEVIRHLKEKGKKLALAVEMFPDSLQYQLDNWNRGQMRESEFINVYNRAWNVSYDFYKNIFLYARENNIPLFGINFDSTHTRYFLNHGISFIPEKALKLIKFESCRENQDYMDSMKSYWGRLGHKKDFLDYCNVRRFKETVMAYNISRILEKEDYTVVVLIGASHAIKNAVPAMLEKHSNGNYTVLLPGKLSDFIQSPLSLEVADFKW